MLETVNTTSQTVASSGTIALGNATVTDANNRMYLEDNTVVLDEIGKYKINAIFTLSNTDSSVDNVTIGMYAGSTLLGIPVTVTVPATSGYEEITIEKTVNVKPSTIGNLASIQFITSTGATVTGCLVDVYKRS